MPEIIAPPKLYLDTNHLVNIAKARRGSKLPSEEFRPAYEQINSWVRGGALGVVFSPAAVLDWIDGKATEESAKQLAAVIDSAQLQYEIEPDVYVYLNEILSECRRSDPSISIPQIPVLHQRLIGETAERAQGVIGREVPGYFRGDTGSDYPSDLPADVTFHKVTDFVDSALEFKARKRDVYNERVQGYQAALRKDMEWARARRRVALTELGKRNWMKQSLKADLVLSALNPELDVDCALEGVDIGRCPGVDLFLKTLLHRIRDGRPPKDNEVDDWMFLHVVPYVDVVLTDREFRDFILRADATLAGKLPGNPSEAVRVLRSMLGAR